MKKYPYLLLFSLSTLAVLAVTGYVFHFRYLTSDEYSYIFQIKTFLSGKLFFSSHEYRLFFTDKLDMIVNDGRWFSRYSFGNALWHVPGFLLGIPRLMQFVTAGLIPCLCSIFAWQFLRDKWIAFAAALLLIVSPLFLFVSSTMLSHGTCSLFILSSFILYQLALSRKNSLYALLSGILFGYAFSTRQFTAILIAIPFCLFFLFYSIKTKKVLIPLLFILGFGLFFGLHLTYNKILTGDFLTETYVYYNPLDTIGLGIRYRAGNYFGMSDALINHTIRLQGLQEFLFGIPYSLWLLLLIGIFSVIKSPKTLILFSTLLMLVVGYFFFYFRGLVELGPNYYYESLPFVMIGVAAGLKKITEYIQRILQDRTRLKQSALFAGGLLLCVYLYYDVSFITQKAKPIQKEAEKVDLFYDLLIEKDLHNALIFTKMTSIYNTQGLLVKNSPNLDDDIVLVHDHGYINRALAETFPTRKAYQYNFTGKRKTSAVQELPFTPIKKRFFPSRTDLYSQFGRGYFAYDKEIDRDIMLLPPSLKNPGYAIFGPFTPMPSGNYSITFRIKTTNNTILDPVVILDVTSGGGKCTYSTKELKGTDFVEEDKYQSFTLGFSLLKPVPDIEFRIFYTGKSGIGIDVIDLDEEYGENNDFPHHSATAVTKMYVISSLVSKNK